MSEIPVEVRGSLLVADRRLLRRDVSQSSGIPKRRKAGGSSQTTILTAHDDNRQIGHVAFGKSSREELFISNASQRSP